MNDNETIQQILNDCNITIVPITGKGDVNRVYIVKQDNNQVVVRLNSEDELKRFKKEAWCLEEASSNGILSPRLIDMGVKNNTAYMMLSFVSGKNGNNIIKDKERIWHTIGTYAKKINVISTRGFGERMTIPGSFSDTWERYLTYNIDSLNPNDKLLKLGTIIEKQSKLIKDRFTRLRKKRFNFALIHGDLSLENVIVEDDKVTLIDWGVAESTIVPHMEIVDLLQNQMSDEDMLFDNFLQGYGMNREEYDSIRRDIDTLTLLQAIDKLRWAIDKKQDQIEEFSQRVKSLVER